MKVMELFDEVEAHTELEGVGVGEHEGSNTVIVKHKPSSIITSVKVEALADFDWPTLESVLTCKTDPINLNHMTRVVGYFSRVGNFNQSKVGELKARIKGQYAVEGSQTSKEERLAAVDSIYSGEQE